MELITAQTANHLWELALRWKAWPLICCVSTWAAITRMNENWAAKLQTHVWNDTLTIIYERSKYEHYHWKVSRIFFFLGGGVFSVTWSFRNHSNMLIWNISYYYYCWKQLYCCIFGMCGICGRSFSFSCWPETFERLCIPCTQHTHNLIFQVQWMHQNWYLIW